MSRKQRWIMLTVFVSVALLVTYYVNDRFDLFVNTKTHELIVVDNTLDTACRFSELIPVVACKSNEAWKYMT